MIKAGIIGGGGYTAGELTRLLVHHPDVHIQWIHSSSHAGAPVSDVHQGLVGDLDLRFTANIDLDNIDVLFCCTPHGYTTGFFAEHPIPDKLKVIDLSNDFRLSDGSDGWVYGLPELNRKPMVRGARLVANPGCFATAIELALLPLAKNLLINSQVHITAITGSTGAGVKPGATTHYSWRNDNVSVYKPFTHQHLPEIRQTLAALQSSFNSELLFIPVRGCFSRGIMATLYLDCQVSIDELKRLYDQYYDDHSFTFRVDRRPDLKDVVNTNKCLIHLEKVGSRLLITSVIDNLLKGAAGTAVHNMNLLFGLHERIGLHLKPSAF